MKINSEPEISNLCILHLLSFSPGNWLAYPFIWRRSITAFLPESGASPLFSAIVHGYCHSSNHNIRGILACPDPMA
jgi:hypothetical protein